MYPFEYRRASTLEQALRMSADLAPAAFLAGGTTLYDLMKLGVERPVTVIDVNRIPELSHLRLSRSALVIGSGVRMSDLADAREVRESFPIIREALLAGATAQIRNMASIGGNLLQRTRCTYFRGTHPCNKRVPGSGCSAREGIDEGQAVLGGSEHCTAVYPGDLATALLALDAAVDVLGPDGARSLALADLHRAPGDRPEQDHTLRPGELITAVRVPATRMRQAYTKLRPRESYSFAWASAAVTLSLHPDTATIEQSRVVLGGLATRPWRVRAVEDWLHGRPLVEAVALEAGRLALRDAEAGRHKAFRIDLGTRAVADALLRAGEQHE
ncbi:FAD binding domain-containing protein [Kineosporia babensis]|uniref:FAD binding domain-containing protein n=1 Tax=Kineosporia babensis TaxID=499548 RepID=A0A9X1NF61_9ACTN|nr:FAD binding domain-containing protein [Kineosporia babensis]MCD5313982.1 FAD binding domain-containing protein [Kineosporia babensis]